MSTPAAEEAVKALREEDDVLLLNALKLVASIAAHPGSTFNATNSRWLPAWGAWGSEGYGEAPLNDRRSIFGT